MDYQEFLKQKTHVDYNSGFSVELSDLNPILYPFQKAIVKWAIKKGRAALFEECGLGKTFQSLEWMVKILQKEGGRGLIVCPLSVASQTIREGIKMGYTVTYVKSESDCVNNAIYITNYERLDNFSGEWQAVVLDESSILKSIDGKTKNKILEKFQKVPYRLSCTATPSPNDISELGNQIAFLGHMTQSEMLSKYFVNDPAHNAGWRLKGHAKNDFYRWVSSWSVFIRRPSDIGFSDDGYILPTLNIDSLLTDDLFQPPDELFPVASVNGLSGRIQERKATVHGKIKKLVDLVNSTDDQWIIWCGLNEESAEARRSIDGAVEVKGEDSPEYKIKAFEDFQKGIIKVLVTKIKIAGFGMNFQNCANMAFVGIGDSFEAYYQGIRRCWRFGQKKEVNVHIILSHAEQGILGNVKRKEMDNAILIDSVVSAMSIYEKEELNSDEVQYMDIMDIKKEKDEMWELWNGDSTELIKNIADNSIDFSIYSPPFSQLYTYSPSPRDLGNCKSDEEFWQHWSFMLKDFVRIMKPGRIMAVHCAQIPAMLGRDGYIGLKDFRGDIIRNFIQAGFIYHGEVTIDKNPQAQSIRTHAKGLTFTQLEKDSSWMRPALADYLVLFRKDGENEIPIENGNDGEISRDEWIRLAHPIWYGVSETRTLNAREARSEDDEKHVCPLQLDTIKNAVRLWSNKGELVFSPFAGIGSEGYQSILEGRRFIGIELKEEYFNVAIKNLKHAQEIYSADELFEEKMEESCV